MTIVDGSRARSKWNYGKELTEVTTNFKQIRSDGRKKMRNRRRRHNRLVGRFECLIERVDRTIMQVEIAFQEAFNHRGAETLRGEGFYEYEIEEAQEGVSETLPDRTQVLEPA
jgi:hypothetical protein